MLPYLHTSNSTARRRDEWSVEGAPTGCEFAFEPWMATAPALRLNFYLVAFGPLLYPSANQHVLGPYVRSAPGREAHGQGDRLAQDGSEVLLESYCHGRLHANSCGEPHRGGRTLSRFRASVLSQVLGSIPGCVAVGRVSVMYVAEQAFAFSNDRTVCPQASILVARLHRTSYLNVP